MSPRAPRPPQRSIKRVVLDNGVKVWTESVPRAKSVAVGVWVDAGSRYEGVNESGSTHLIQRAAFHGTRRRSARTIAGAVASLGGHVTIATERDHAGYLAQVASSDMVKALELLADLALNPIFDRAGVAAEQKKILLELREAQNDPDFNLECMFLRSIWMGRGLCRPPQGRLLTFRDQTKLFDFKPKSLRRMHRESHHPRAITVTLSGNLRHSEAADRVRALFGSLEEPEHVASTLSTMSHRFVALRNRAQFDGVRMMLGSPSCGAPDAARHVAGALNLLLGGGPSSRLARLLRRKRLPAQRATSRLMMFSDAGVLAVQLRTQQGRAAEALAMTVAELRTLAAEPVAAKELEDARDTQRSALLTPFGSTTERIHDMAPPGALFRAHAQSGRRAERD